MNTRSVQGIRMGMGVAARHVARVLFSGVAASLAAGCHGVPSADERAAYAEVGAAAACYRPPEGARALPPLTADAEPVEYVRRAVLGSREVERRFHVWRAAVSEITLARSRPDPVLSLRLEVGTVLEEFVPAIGALFPPHDRLRYGALARGAGARAQRAAFEQSVLDVAAEAWAAYFEAALLEETLRVDREVDVLLVELEEIVSQQVSVGNVTQQDLLRVSAERDELENEIAGLEDTRPVLVARLRRLFGLEEGEPDPPLPSRYPATVAELDEPAMLALLRTRNRDIAMRESELREAVAGVALAHATRHPEVMLSAGVNTKSPRFLEPMLGISLPVWRDRIRAEVEAARARRDAAGSALEAERLARTAALAEALFAWRDAGRRLALYRDKLMPKGREALEVARVSYTTSRTDLTALLDAERSLKAYRLGEARARRDREAAWALLVFPLVGTGPGVEAVPPPPAPEGR